jgi:ectoine hydroxylase-related dioxygenase (phytanoyl-CoA dioxygenase family)
MATAVLFVGSQYNSFMDDWFSKIKTSCELSTNALTSLEDVGFVVIPGPFEIGELSRISAAYDSVVSSAAPDDIRIGSSTTRVNGLVDRNSGFDALYTHKALLAASDHIIGGPFKLSSMHARTLRPNSSAQGLHIDFKQGEDRFPLAGFIFMVDEFAEVNGATGFVPGSHKWSVAPNDHALADHKNNIQIARGLPGSLIVFNGSVWHGHMANLTNAPRRSIQGAYIPRDARSGTDFKSRLHSKTLSQISPLAKYLLAI